MGVTIGGMEEHQYYNRMNANQYLAQRPNAWAEARRIRSEEQLQIQQQLLGSQDQLSGTLGGVSAEVLPYLSRYQFDPGAAGLRFRGGKTLGQGFLQQRTDAANAILQQAEDAARAGDYDLANDLREQARVSLTVGADAKRGQWRKSPFGDLSGLEGLEGIWDLVEDPRQAAMSALQNEQALIVGKQLQESRAFQDWDSQESMDERMRLREPGERAIRAGEREALRMGRNERLMSGVGQSAFGARLRDERTREQFATQSAQLEADVAMQFNNYRRQYATNAVAFARSYIQGQGGIREEFQSSLDGLVTGMQQLAANYADNATRMSLGALDYSMYQQNREMARSAMTRDSIGALLGTLSQWLAGRNQ